MEFYELLKEIVGFIPDEFQLLRELSALALPWVMGICTAATCFFGHKLHGIWKAFLFFWIGFFFPLLIIQLILKLDGALFWISVALCAALGVLCAVKSKKLHKIELFVTTFFLVFIAVPPYLSFLGNFGSAAAGFITATAAAILSIRYKYITVIVTTGFTGAFLLFGMIENITGLSHTLITALAVFAGLAGIAVQCFVERKELKETSEHLKKRKEQIKSVPDKIKSHKES